MQISLGRVSTYGGIRLIADRHLVDIVEDWSEVRSPSRAARRFRQGHRQRIRYREVPKLDIIYLPGEGVMVAHPDTIAKLYVQFDRYATRRREEQRLTMTPFNPSASCKPPARWNATTTLSASKSE